MAEEVEIVLKMEPYSRRTLSPSLLDVAKRIVGMETMHEEVSTFQIKGRDSETEEIELLDLLNDKLISTKHILLLRIIFQEAGGPP